MASGGPIALAVIEPGGHAERVIHDLEIWAVEHQDFEVRDRRHGRELEGLIFVYGPEQASTDDIAAAIHDAAPDWEQVLERVHIGEQRENELATNR